MNIKKMREDFDSSMEPPDDPTIVCLCGSTRFGEAFAKANLEETLAGRIVLTIGCNMKSDSELFGSMSAEELKRVKTELDELHKRKIDIADEVLVLNVGGYIGESTRSEIEYAKQHGKKIRYLTPQPAPVPTLVDDTCECRTGIYSAIDRERDYQDKKWGKAHDSEHTVAEFLLIIELELAEAKQAWIKGRGDNDALRELLQVIAVGVACLEVHGCYERGNSAGEFFDKDGGK